MPLTHSKRLLKYKLGRVKTTESSSCMTTIYCAVSQRRHSLLRKSNIHDSLVAPVVVKFVVEPYDVSSILAALEGQAELSLLRSISTG